jgi:hypothetical protein
LSYHSQKLYISAHEFVQSWDKELYQLKVLDYFIFLFINYLGNQLDGKFFESRRKISRLYLEFEEIGTLCFDLGDSLDSFFKKNCLKNCPVKCLSDLDGYINVADQKINLNLKHKLYLLQSFLPGNLEKEQILKIDLMNYVILDTLIQFYDAEMQIELREDDLELVAIAEFIENTIIHFIRTEGSHLLNRHTESAMEIFEELLNKETSYEKEEQWNEDQEQFGSNDFHDHWLEKVIPIEEVFISMNCQENFPVTNPNESILENLNYLERYLTEHLNLKNIYDLNDFHLGNFFSVWLVHEFEKLDRSQIDAIFQASARFITFIYQQYNINIKQEFLYYYNSLKLDLPRVVAALNIFIQEYDVLNSILKMDTENKDRQSGFYEIIRLYGENSHVFDATDIKLSHNLGQIKLPSNAFNKLHKGDILSASLFKNFNHWTVGDIEYIYPNLAKKYFLYNFNE